MLQSIPVPRGISATASGTTPAFYDVDLSSYKFDEINFDSTKIPNQPGQVDGILTTTDCTQMFAGPYTGTPVNPLCRIILGPVGPGGVTSRISLAAGKYRVWAQPYSTNTGDVQYGFDVVLWGPNCNNFGSLPMSTGGF
jgi:hypothetical protein